MTAPIRIAIATLVIGLVAGIATIVGNATIIVPLVYLNIVALAFALLARRLSGPIDIFEPLTVFLTAWTVMFVLRPLGMLTYNDMTLRGAYDVSSGLPYALFLGALGSAAFGAAYSLRSARTVAEGVRNRVTGWEVPPGAGTTIALVCIALSAVGGLATFARITTAYVTYLPLLAVPGSLLLLAIKRPRWRRAPLIAAAGLILLLLEALAVGQRSTVLHVVGSLVVFYYLRRGRRPSAALLAAAATLLLLLVVNGLEVLRGPAQVGRPFDPTLITVTDFAPDSAMKRLITGGSTEMLPALALQVETEGSTWHFTPGYLVAAVATHWVPGGLWADKPRSSAELLYSIYFPENYKVNRANTQFSVLGDYYYDLGAPGVFLGMFILGFGARLMGGLLAAASTSRAALLLYSPFIAIFVLLLRGDITLTLGIALYIYAPLIVAVAFGRFARRARDGTDVIRNRDVHAR